MPQQRSQNLSPRRRTGIMGPNTRQRTALDWTPLSLHHFGESPMGLAGSLPLTRARTKLAAGSFRAHACTSLLSGTVRGYECVSRTWGRRKLSHPLGAEASRFGALGG